MVSSSKSKEHRLPVDKTANFDKEEIAADQTGFAQETFFNEKELPEALSKEKFCKLGTPFKPSDLSLRQLCFTCGAEQCGHQSREDEKSSVKQTEHVVSSKGFSRAGKYLNIYFEKSLITKCECCGINYKKGLVYDLHCRE